MSTPQSVDLLLENARQIDTGRIRRLALGVRSCALELDKELRTERSTRRMSELRRELHNLEITLGVSTNPGGRVSGGTDRAASVDYDPAAVRLWAKAHGWDAPAKGRYLPVDLVTAYRADRHEVTS